MTASKSTRARNARAAARNGTANRAGTAARNAAAGRSAAAGTGTAGGPGTGAGTGAAAGTGTGAGAGTGTKNGTAGKNGTGKNGTGGTGTARTGTAVRAAGAGTRDLNRAANGGTAVRTRQGAAVRGDAAGGAGRGDVRARQGTVRADEVASAGPSLWLQLTTFVLALAGLGVSTYLTIAHFTQATLAGCSETSGLVDCTKVTTSAQSYVFGIPVALLGLLFYVFVVAIMSPWAWRAQRREIHLARIAAMVAGIGFVIYLLYAELFIIGNICLYCTSVHVITFVLFVFVMFSAAVWGLRPAARRSADSQETAE